MMIEEFYQALYLDIFYRYIVLKKHQYQEDNLTYIESKNNSLQRYIRLDSDSVYGKVTVWNIGVIEEEIIDKKTNKRIFYLHYKVTSIARSQELFNAFYQSLLQQVSPFPKKILLCCSSGITTSFFVEKLRKLITLENVNIQVDAIAYHQIQNHYLNYDSLYLAPQIAYLMSEVMSITANEIPVHCIQPTTYATYNCQELLSSFMNQKADTPIC